MKQIRQHKMKIFKYSILNICPNYWLAAVINASKYTTILKLTCRISLNLG